MLATHPQTANLKNKPFEFCISDSISNGISPFLHCMGTKKLKLIYCSRSWLDYARYIHAVRTGNQPTQ